MQYDKFIVRGLAAALIATVAAWAAVSHAEDEAAPSSGFLDPSIESQLETVKTSGGLNVMRWTSPEMAQGKYDAVMVDRVIFYPAPNPGPQISSRTLEDIADYLTEALRRELAKQVKVTDTAGVGVLRMQPAITAVTASTKGLSPLDVIPMHLVFTAVKTATGHQAKNVMAAVEVRITDSMSGDYVAAAKRTIKGKPLKGDKDQLTLDDYKEALDNGAAAGAVALEEALTQ